MTYLTDEEKAALSKASERMTWNYQRDIARLLAELAEKDAQLRLSQQVNARLQGQLAEAERALRDVQAKLTQIQESPATMGSGDLGRLCDAVEIIDAYLVARIKGEKP